MKLEYFDIYNENMEPIGTKLRSEVHKQGFWHKTFQCWFVYNEGSKQYILFQKRHPDKDTYPDLLDITAAGHLSTGETVEDASRELEEELGIQVEFNKLVSIGIIKEEKMEDTFIDREFANIFLYYCDTPIEEFKLQPDEVVGMFKARLGDVVSLFNSEVDEVTLEGYEIDDSIKIINAKLKVGIKDFVPHGKVYYNQVFQAAGSLLKQI